MFSFSPKHGIMLLFQTLLERSVYATRPSLCPCNSVSLDSTQAIGTLSSFLVPSKCSSLSFSRVRFPCILLKVLICKIQRMTGGRTDARTDRLNSPKPNKGATLSFPRLMRFQCTENTLGLQFLNVLQMAQILVF